MSSDILGIILPLSGDLTQVGATMPLYAQYHIPNLWSSNVQGWVGLVQKYLIFISILSDLTLLKLVSYLILEIKGGLSLSFI